MGGAAEARSNSGSEPGRKGGVVAHSDNPRP